MILITGATGNVGRALVRVLDQEGADVRVLVRDRDRAAELPVRAERAVGDLTVPETLEPVFRGVDRVFLLTQGIGVDQAANAVAAARAAGVRHIVLLSSMNVIPDPMPAMGHWHHAREQLLLDSGIPTTFLRPGGFATNALEWAGTIRAGGYVLDPTGPGRFSMIDPADIAAVAAVTLLQDGHQGRAYAPTGDETGTVADHVSTLAAALGRPIEVRTAATPEEAVQARYPQGAPPALAAAILEGFTMMRADTVGFRTDDVERLLGRRPLGFAQWCARNIDFFS
ncbi:NAD(P)H-binding protein [Catenulispora yoronensis]|uniref:NAD(P)H-binding protein n=1 Tax=Catenulispora yoronensis TaxID=450799 RepID=A0ABN2TYZ3_9ACTN